MQPTNPVPQAVDKPARQDLAVRLLLARFLLMAFMVVAFWLAYRSG
jgi:hypothetical protein